MSITKLSVALNVKRAINFNPQVRFICNTDDEFPLPVVTIVNALTPLSKNLGLLMKQSPYISELRLYDKDKKICGVAEDLSHIDTKTRVKSFGGETSLAYAVAGADVVVLTGGCQKTMGESVKSMFQRNVDDARNTALHVSEFNPRGILCIATPPIEAIVPMVSEELKKVGSYDPRKVIGITTAASIRAAKVLGDHAGKNPCELLSPITGGTGPNTTVTVISQTRPHIKVNPMNLVKLQQTIASGDNEILRAYAERSTACLLPALAMFRFVNNLVKTIKLKCKVVDCAFVRHIGSIGTFLPYMTSIVVLGKEGVLSTHMPRISGDEAYHLKKAAKLIKESIQVGESFVTGSVNFEKCSDVVDECGGPEGGAGNQEVQENTAVKN